MTMHRSFRIHLEGGRETVLMGGKGKTDGKEAAQKFVKVIFNNKRNFTVSFLRRKLIFVILKINFNFGCRTVKQKQSQEYRRIHAFINSFM